MNKSPVIFFSSIYEITETQHLFIAFSEHKNVIDVSEQKQHSELN